MWDHFFCAGGECRDGPPRPLECEECGRIIIWTFCISVGMVLPDHWNVRNVGVSSYGLSVYQVNSIYGLLRRAVILLGYD